MMGNQEGYVQVVQAAIQVGVAIEQENSGGGVGVCRMKWVLWQEKIGRFGEPSPRVMWCNWGQRSTRLFEGSEKSVAILRSPYDWIAANNCMTFSTSHDFLDLLNSVSSLFYFTCSGTY
nr:hypothetical protein CFP56_79489 [Quercus suber]